jgi:glycosyltransferase involved in cell wall biosynthesis
MKRVLVVGFTDNPGGIENVVMNYYRNFDRKKVQLDFLYSTNTIAFNDEIKSLGGNTYKITAKHSDYSKYKKELKEFFEKNGKNYDAIWVNFCNITNLDYFKLAKKYGINKRIIHSHNNQNMASKLVLLIHKLNRLLINKYATDYWACSDTAADWFYTKKVRKENKILIVNNAVDLDRFKYNESISKKYKNDLGLDGKFVIGHVGRFHFQKNQLFLLDVFNKIHEKDKDSVLVLVGQGEDEQKIKEKIKDLNLKSSVKLLGVRDDVNKVIQAMDVFLFPSVFEGLGLVLVEAQAAGIPVVSSCDKTPKIVKMSDNFKFLSLNDSLDTWRDAVLDFKGTKKIDNSKTIISKGYDIKTEAKKIEKFFERN